MAGGEALGEGEIGEGEGGVGLAIGAVVQVEGEEGGVRVGRNNDLDELRSVEEGGTCVG